VTTDPFDTVFFLLGLAPPAPLVQLSGNRLVQAPEWAWTLRGIYDFATPYNGWNGEAVLEASYKDDVYFTQFNYVALGQESVTTINANLKFTSPDEKWALNLWGKNLTDEDIYTGTFIINGSRTNAGNLAPPRTFGATLSYNF
jgi:iron complex outermembrane receptor protein